MKSHSRTTVAFAILATIAGAQFAAAAEPGVPVEESMHEFMEYVFQPTYKRLKVQMAAEEKDRAVWKAVKSDSLILAESSNLLLIRLPDKDADAWVKQTKLVRETGGKLYHAAKEADEDAAQKIYRTMLNHCNACHKQFADGKYQLQP